MSGAPRLHSTPGSGAVLRAIATRELRLASRRRVVRWLFLISLLPVLVFATVLAVRIWGERNLGAALAWDPVPEFLGVQTLPVGLLALAVGVPSVARDRAHDVLFLYATRPVLPYHYVLGKWLSTAVPAALLLLLPACAIAGLRWGLLSSVGFTETAVMVARALTASVLLGAAVAGVCVGASAAVKRDRNGYLIALAVFFVPDIIAQSTMGPRAWASPPGAARHLLSTLFDGGGDDAVGAMVVLAAYAVAGIAVAVLRVRREMVP